MKSLGVNSEQVFEAPVGQVAAGDIKNNTVNATFRHETTVIHLPELRPESQQQAEFAARTGIWCPKAARLWLEDLMENHGFTARDLSVAWSAKSLGWNASTGERTINTPWIEAVGAWAMVAMVTTLLLSVGISWAISTAPRSVAADLSVFGAAAVYLGMVWLVSRTMLSPRRIAMRVRRAGTSL